ncbi:hypothetical protein ACQEU3_14550 [Spirillospora sp. CA-253888]
MQILCRVAWDYAAHELAPETLPMVAAEALVRGVGSPALRELAGCSDDVREIRDLYLAAMAELGVEIPTEEAAYWEKVRAWAGLMVDRTVAPHEGAARITAYFDVVGCPPEAGDLYYLVDLWSDRPADRRRLERDMIGIARGLIRGRRG